MISRIIGALAIAVADQVLMLRAGLASLAAAGTVRLAVDPDRASAAGVTNQDVSRSSSTALNGARIGTLVPLTLATHLAPAELPAYGQLLLDVLSGNSALSIRADEAEESWRVVTPVLDAWSKELVPLQEYAAGSDGPPRLPP